MRREPKGMIRTLLHDATQHSQPKSKMGIFTTPAKKLSGNLMTPRRRNFRPQARSNDEATTIMWSLRRSDAEWGRKVRRPPELLWRWAGKGPPASLLDLNDSVDLSRFGPPPSIRAFSGPSRGH
jgi:hypothetical protein